MVEMICTERYRIEGVFSNNGEISFVVSALFHRFKMCTLKE
jgi:hypothetical protein